MSARPLMKNSPVHEFSYFFGGKNTLFREKTRFNRFDFYEDMVCTSTVSCLSASFARRGGRFGQAYRDHCKISYDRLFSPRNTSKYIDNHTYLTSSLNLQYLCLLAEKYFIKNKIRPRVCGLKRVRTLSLYRIRILNADLENAEHLKHYNDVLLLTLHSCPSKCTGCSVLSDSRLVWAQFYQ